VTLICRLAGMPIGMRWVVFPDKRQASRHHTMSDSSARGMDKAPVIMRA